MIITITPDLPFRAGFLQLLLRAVVIGLLGLVPFYLGQYANTGLWADRLPETFTFFSRNLGLFFWSLAFVVMIRSWHTFNQTKRIHQIQFDSRTNSCCIEYRHLLGRRVVKETLQPEALWFQLDGRRAEAELGHHLAQPFKLNQRTGFSLNQLVALQELVQGPR